MAEVDVKTAIAPVVEAEQGATHLKVFGHDIKLPTAREVLKLANPPFAETLMGRFMIARQQMQHDLARAAAEKLAPVFKMTASQLAHLIAIPAAAANRPPPDVNRSLPSEEAVVRTEKK